MISDLIMDDSKAANNKTAPLQTTKDDKMQSHNNHHEIEHSNSETDILAAYQQRHRRRKSNGDKRPTKRAHGEPYSPSQTSSSNTTCFKESLYILFTWLSYGLHVVIVLIPYDMIGGSIGIETFYSQNQIQISAASWNFIQWLFIALWEGIILVYLSLIIAEHTIKIFDNGFYIGLGISNIFMSLWDILTEQQSYLGRILLFLGTIFCLFYVNYVVLRHIYDTFDVTAYEFPSNFQLDAMPTPSTKATPDTQFATNSHHNMPPLTIHNSQYSSRNSSKRNINAYIERIQHSGPSSVNSSPVSQSMAPSAAQRLVYEAAMAAHRNDNGNDWLLTKTMDLTQAKYVGLVGIVFNGCSYFLSVTLLNMWLQIGVWLVYGQAVSDNDASIISLTLMFVTILAYYYLDFYQLSKYLIWNFATHIVFIINFSSMSWRHVVDDGTYSFVALLELLILFVVVVAFVLKIGNAYRMHRRNEQQKNNVYSNGVDEDQHINDEYEIILE